MDRETLFAAERAGPVDVALPTRTLDAWAVAAACAVSDPAKPVMDSPRCAASGIVAVNGWRNLEWTAAVAPGGDASKDSRVAKGLGSDGQVKVARDAVAHGAGGGSPVASVSTARGCHDEMEWRFGLDGRNRP